MPDSQTPISETLSGVDEVYKLGLFRRFGLSNFKAPQVQAVYDHCAELGYVLPTVYQGNYNAVARLPETVLLPTLRRLGIAFYAYSPLAGGFLTKTVTQIQTGAPAGRFTPGHRLHDMYRDLYVTPAYLAALGKWEVIAHDERVSPAELAYRWVTYHSALKPEKGDAVVFGASSLLQLEETLVGIEKGPLSEKASKEIQGVWETVEHDAPLDNINRRA